MWFVFRGEDRFLLVFYLVIRGMRRVEGMFSAGLFMRRFPLEMVREALAAEGVSTRRVRKCPAELTVYFTMLLGMFRDEGYGEVFTELVSHQQYRHLVAHDTLVDLIPGSPAIKKARDRVGWKPLKRLFDQAAQADPGEVVDGLWHGKRLIALDGVQFDAPDEAELWRVFSGPSTGAYPKPKLIVASDVRARTLVGATIGAYNDHEVGLVERVVPQLPVGAVCLFDRAYGSGRLCRLLAERGCHFVVRVKSCFKLAVEQYLPDGSWLTWMRDDAGSGMMVRALEYQVETVDEETGESTMGERVTVITDLVDPAEYMVEELVELYGDRWCVEVDIREMKESVCASGELVLRSKTPDGVRSELWGILCAYQAMCHVIGEVATAKGAAPPMFSFKAVAAQFRRSLAIEPGAFSPSRLGHVPVVVVQTARPPRQTQTLV